MALMCTFFELTNLSVVLYSIWKTSPQFNGGKLYTLDNKDFLINESILINTNASTNWHILLAFAFVKITL